MSIPAPKFTTATTRAITEEGGALTVEFALDARDRRVLAAIQNGLPLVSRPFRAIAEAVDMSEDDVIARVQALLGRGVIKRMGVVVRHHELGFRANAMVVWDVPDERVVELGRKMAAFPAVRLCYRRPRRPPAWPYNLFCMIHGRDRESVLRSVSELVERCGLHDTRRDVLFSTRRFKQRGAWYGPPLADCAIRRTETDE